MSEDHMVTQIAYRRLAIVAAADYDLQLMRWREFVSVRVRARGLAI